MMCLSFYQKSLREETSKQSTLQDDVTQEFFTFLGGYLSTHEEHSLY